MVSAIGWAQESSRLPVPPLLLSALLVAAPPSTRTLDGRATDRNALRASVVMFWRTDCGPCLAELADLAQLRKAAAPLRVQPVVLDGAPGRAGPVAAVLARAGLTGRDTLRGVGDPAALLTAYGGDPPRLPLAVAFDRTGRVCGRRTGFLGYDHLRAWARACGTSDAARR